MNLWDRIDDYVIEDRKKSREKNSHYPSEVTKCRRALYYKHAGYEPTDPPTAGGILKMEAGNALHEMVHHLLEKAGVEVVDEVPIKVNVPGAELPVSGRLDYLIVDDDGELAGVEAKTSYGRFIKNIQTNNYPRESDIEQVLVYMGLTEIKRFYILYFGRDNAYRCQFVVYKDGDKYYCSTNLNGRSQLTHTTPEILFERFGEIERSAKGAPPPRDYKLIFKHGEARKEVQKNKVKYQSDWQCMYCDYQGLCHAGESEKYAESDNIKELFGGK